MDCCKDKLESSKQLGELPHDSKMAALPAYEKTGRQASQKGSILRLVSTCDCLCLDSYPTDHFRYFSSSVPDGNMKVL